MAYYVINPEGEGYMFSPEPGQENKLPDGHIAYEMDPERGLVEMDQRIISDPNIQYGDPGSIGYTLATRGNLNNEGFSNPKAVADFLEKVGAPKGYDWSDAISKAWQKQQSQFGKWSGADDPGQTALKVLNEVDAPWKREALSKVAQSPEFAQSQKAGTASLAYDPDAGSIMGIPGPIASALLGAALGPAGLNVGAALGGGIAGAAGTGALSSVLTGGNPLTGALMGGLNSGLGSVMGPEIGSTLSDMGISKDVMPYLLSGGKALLTGGDVGSSLLNTAISGGINKIAGGDAGPVQVADANQYSGTQTDSPIYDTPASNIDWTGGTVDFGGGDGALPADSISLPVADIDWTNPLPTVDLSNSSQTLTSGGIDTSFLNDPNFGAADYTQPITGGALGNTGYVPNGYTVDLGDSKNLKEAQAGALAGVNTITNTTDASTGLTGGNMIDETMNDTDLGFSQDTGDVDMTGFNTDPGPIDWGGGKSVDDVLKDILGDGYSGSTLNTIGDGTLPNTGIDWTGGDYTVDLGNSQNMVDTDGGGISDDLWGKIKNAYTNGDSDGVKELLKKAPGLLTKFLGGNKKGPTNDQLERYKLAKSLGLDTSAIENEINGNGGGGALGGLMPLLLAGGVLEGMFKDNKTTSTVKLPEWYEAGAQKALSAADAVANQPFKAFTGDAVAPLSENEKAAIAMAKNSAGNWQPLLDDATAMTKASTQSIKDMDLNAYMNPYLDLVYEPSKRQIEREIAQMKMANDAKAGMRGAFGGSRNSIENSLLDERKLNALSDLYGTSYSKAFDSATALATSDLGRKANAAGALTSQAGVKGAMTGSDIGRLGTTGEAERSVDQAKKSFDLDQFNKEQDWGKRSIDAYTSALRGAGDPGKTTTSNPPAPSVLGQAAGALGTYGALNGWFS